MLQFQLLQLDMFYTSGGHNSRNIKRIIRGFGPDS